MSYDVTSPAIPYIMSLISIANHSLICYCTLHYTLSILAIYAMYPEWFVNTTIHWSRVCTYWLRYMGNQVWCWHEYLCQPGLSTGSGHNTSWIRSKTWCKNVDNCLQPMWRWSPSIHMHVGKTYFLRVDWGIINQPSMFKMDQEPLTYYLLQ